MPKHTTPIRIYYEDTDAGGVVYYANYLKFAERARTEWLRAKGFSQRELAASEDPVLFVVRKVTMELKKPAYLDDVLTIETELLLHQGARLTLRQNIVREEKIISEIEVEIVAVNSKFVPRKVPREVLES